ncbi:hypothetical protein IIA95_01035 [Patescibacteria group bacterium]|nr:hypothetical protein [Patescibacteria group bacterium]
MLYQNYFLVNVRKEIENKIQSFCTAVVDKRVASVLHLRGLFNESVIKETREYLTSLKYEPFKNENKINRYESFINEVEISAAQFQKEAILLIEKYLSIKPLFKFEYYAFKQKKGHSIPKHKDKDRHQIVSMFYAGSFTGGEYVYWFKGRKKVLSLREGSMLLGINQLHKKFIGVEHEVNKITSGERLVLAISLCKPKPAS